MNPQIGAVLHRLGLLHHHDTLIYSPSCRIMAKVTLGILEEVTVPIALEVSPKGLTLHRLQLDTAAVAHDIVPGPYDEKDIPSKYVNTVIGRYSNRIPVSSEGYAIEKGGYKNVVKPIANGTMCF